jgi:hypothetical protein
VDSSRGRLADGRSNGRNAKRAGQAPPLVGGIEASLRFEYLVPETGVEPATYALRMRRSTD